MLVSLLLVGCSSQKPPVNPVRILPDFISADIIRRDSECIEVELRLIWEGVETDEELKAHISNTLDIKIDGFESRVPDVSFALIAAPIIDEQGITHYITTPMVICIAYDKFSFGEHSASIHFSSISGKEYQYSWNFYVPK